MSNQDVTVSLITDIADSIRETKGTTAKLTLAQMPNAIEGKSGSVSGTYVGKSGLESLITAIGDSIRTAGGTTATLTLAQMPDAIRSIKPTPEKAIADIDAVWGTDSMWATIAKYGDTIRENPGKFSKYIGRTATYRHSSYGSQSVRVVGICHYGRSDGKGKAAFTFDHVAIPVLQKMNSSNTTSGGYPASVMKTFLEGTFFNGMPASVRGAITPVTIPCSLTAGATPTSTPNCKVFLLSEKEVFGTNSYANEGTQLAWYSANNTDAKRVKNYDGYAYLWWLRSPNSFTSFATVYGGGYLGGNGAKSERGACPGFNIG